MSKELSADAKPILTARELCQAIMVSVETNAKRTRDLQIMAINQADDEVADSMGSLAAGFKHLTVSMQILLDHCDWIKEKKSDAGET